MNCRFDTEMGYDGYLDDLGRLKPFGARYRFAGRTWAITVWAHGWQDAKDYCQRHGLKLDGQIIGRIDTE